MSRNQSSRLLAMAATVLLIGSACHKSSTSPSSQKLTDFVTDLRASDGVTAASRSSGSAPSASGGPAVTATTSGTATNATVINGGSTVVRLRAGSAFNTVFLSVIDDPLDGFYKLTLPSSTTDTLVILTLGRTIPINTFQTVFSVANGSSVGATASIANTVNTTAVAGQVQVSLTWNTPTDIDLHVVDPKPEEIFWNHRSAASGGALDLDSNAGCGIDNINNENIRWTTTAPNGNYIVRVDNWSSCSNSAVTTQFSVVVTNNGTSTLFTGTFTDSGDFGSTGAGRQITQFTHTGGTLTTQDAPLNLQDLLSPSQLKRRMSGVE